MMDRLARPDAGLRLARDDASPFALAMRSAGHRRVDAPQLTMHQASSARRQRARRRHARPAAECR
ncbi:hypothetical protein GR157_11240 [Burkholderia sp. 4701]|nr:hypothetical protein [Burkholderia sp. 4701]MXN82500.1 hypothetical protein [Burkholderia sp. 4812]